MRYLTVIEAAQVLDCSRSAVYRLLNIPELKEYVQKLPNGSKVSTQIAETALPIMRRHLPRRFDPEDFAAALNDEPEAEPEPMLEDLQRIKVEELEAQLAALKADNVKLLDALRAEQELHKVTAASLMDAQQRIALLTKRPDPEEEETPRAPATAPAQDPPSTPGLFKRIKVWLFGA